jgi:hypothetical protein
MIRVTDFVHGDFSGTELMKTNLTSLVITVLLSTFHGVLLAEDSLQPLPAGHPLYEIEEFVINHEGQLSEDEMSQMRAQGFQMPALQMGVILWDEVDNNTRPKAQLTNTDGSITVTVN